MSKVVFLDMDGVLCTIRAHIGQRQAGLMEVLDREAVGLLNSLLVDDARVVLSSTWRLFHDAAWMTDHLRKFGWTGNFHADWRTKQLHPRRLSESVPRGKEIKEWLERHPEVSGYVILDDDSDMLEEQKPHFVHTHYEDGFLWRHFLDAFEILHGRLWSAAESLKETENV